MQTTAIFSLFIFGAVAVVAEKKLEEENGGGHGIDNRKYGRPVPKALLVKRPEEGEYPDDSRLFDPNETQGYFWYFKKEIKKVITRTKRKFQNREKKINQKEKKLEALLKNKFDTAERRLKAQQETEVRKAVKAKKKREDIEKCFRDEGLDFNDQMKGDYEDALQCVKTSAEEAREILEEAKDKFNKTSARGFDNGKHYAELVKSCVPSGNAPCVQYGIRVLRKDLTKMREESNSQIENLDIAAENLKDQMDTCREDLVRHLDDGKEAYLTKMRKCLDD